MFLIPTNLPPLATLVLGAVYCFAGWPLYRIIVAVTGFLVGMRVGTLLFAAMFPQREALALIVAIVIGLVGAWLAIRFIGAIAFLVGFALVFGGTSVALGSLSLEPPLPLILAVVLGIVGGILAVSILRLGITIGTAYIGATLLLDGVRGFGFAPPPGLYLMVLLGLTVVGILAQYGSGRSQG